MATILHFYGVESNSTGICGKWLHLSIGRVRIDFMECLCLCLEARL